VRCPWRLVFSLIGRRIVRILALRRHRKSAGSAWFGGNKPSSTETAISNCPNAHTQGRCFSVFELYQTTLERLLQLFSNCVPYTHYDVLYTLF
jgi:hypothetical protein